MVALGSRSCSVQPGAFVDLNGQLYPIHLNVQGIGVSGGGMLFKNKTGTLARIAQCGWNRCQQGCW